MKIVPGYGPPDSRLMFIGEAPGQIEATTNIPFSGPSGSELARYLRMFDIDLNRCYRTNICKEYKVNNPDPTPDQIRFWLPTLLEEIDSIKPDLIVTVGRFSSQVFLGENCGPMEIIHGLPQKSILPDYDGIVIPAFHTAAGLWKHEKRSLIRFDYEQVANTYRDIRSGKHINVIEDPYHGKEDYLDLSGKGLADYLDPIKHCPIIGYDTEGEPDDRISIQISLSPGSGFMLRTDRNDFSIGRDSFVRFLHRCRPIIAMHQAQTPDYSCYDVVMSRAENIELNNGLLDWYDTQYWAYIRNIESLSNKTLCQRFQKMEMVEYESLIEGLSEEKQLDYLEKVINLNLPKPDKVREKDNSGYVSFRQPNKIGTTVDRIIADKMNGKVDNKGNPVNLLKRWDKIKESNPEQYKLVTNILGKMPKSTLRDIDYNTATFYACRDADGSLRNALKFQSISTDREKSLMSEGMKLLPIIESIQRVGVPVSKSKFQSLFTELDSNLDKLNDYISTMFWNGERFNPKSPQDVLLMCKSRGLTPTKKTGTGGYSTGKDSIEEFRYSDPAIAMIFDFREMQHNRDTYCADILERTEDSDTDINYITSVWRPCKVPSRRMATAHVNILGVPSRTEEGLKVRKCYIAPPGKVWAGFDLSGIEMRCMASESNDVTLCNAFINGISIHKDTACRLFGIDSIDKVSKLDKAVAKTINFLTIYGGAEHRLYTEFRTNNIMKYSLSDCRKLLDDWFSVYSGVDRYCDNVKREAKRVEGVYDYWGAYRSLPGINCGDRKIEAEEARSAVSQKIQGLAAGMIRNSMIWIWSIIKPLMDQGELDKDCLRIFVHDELDFLVSKGQEELIYEIVMEGLTNHCGVKLKVPVEAEAHFGLSWGDLKGD